VNSEVFQDANGVKQLMECKKANDDKSECVATRLLSRC
jgi:hypothetical protein